MTVPGPLRRHINVHVIIYANSMPTMLYNYFSLELLNVNNLCAPKTL